jgi:hypothetical protein
MVAVGVVLEVFMMAVGVVLDSHVWWLFVYFSIVIYDGGFCRFRQLFMMVVCVVLDSSLPPLIFSRDLFDTKCWVSSLQLGANLSMCINLCL